MIKMNGYFLIKMKMCLKFSFKVIIICLKVIKCTVLWVVVIGNVKGFIRSGFVFG